MNPLLWLINPFRWRSFQRRCQDLETSVELLTQSLSEERETVTFLVERITDFDTPVPRETVGRSSNAMIVAAMRGAKPQPIGAGPYDRGDLDRCERTYLRAPAHLKRKMVPILEEWRQEIKTKEHRPTGT